MLSHITMFQPSAVDNALSTMQIIHKLINEMNIVIDEVNSIDSKANEYTDSKVLELKNQLEGQITLLNNRVTNLSSDVSTYTELVYEISNLIVQLQTRLTSEIARLDSKIDNNKIELLQSINNTLNLAKNYTDSEINKLKLYLEKLIKERTLYTYNIWNGKKEKIDKVILDSINIFTANVTKPITIAMLKKFLTVNMQTSSNVNTTLSDFTFGELKSVVENSGAGFTATLQKTQSETAKTLPIIKNTFYNAKVNQLARIYGIGYRLFRTKDIGNYVVPYRYYSAVTMYTGIDTFQLQESFSYIYNV